KKTPTASKTDSTRKVTASRRQNATSAVLASFAPSLGGNSRNWHGGRSVSLLAAVFRKRFAVTITRKVGAKVFEDASKTCQDLQNDVLKLEGYASSRRRFDLPAGSY